MIIYILLGLCFLKLEYIPEPPQGLGKIQNVGSILDHVLVVSAKRTIKQNEVLLNLEIRVTTPPKPGFICKGFCLGKCFWWKMKERPGEAGRSSRLWWRSDCEWGERGKEEWEKCPMLTGRVRNTWQGCRGVLGLVTWWWSTPPLTGMSQALCPSRPPLWLGAGKHGSQVADQGAFSCLTSQ